MKGQSIVQVAKINLYNFPWNELKKVWSSRVKINQLGRGMYTLTALQI